MNNKEIGDNNMNNDIYLLTKNLDIVVIPNLVNFLSEGKTALTPEETYIALSFNYESINKIKNKIIDGEKNIENKKTKNKKNLLKDNMFKTFDVWVKPIVHHTIITSYKNHNDPIEKHSPVAFKLYYEKIENCRIVCGFKEGCYGIITNGVVFDHIPIQLFNEKKICSVIGDTYEILLFDPYK